MRDAYAVAAEKARRKDELLAERMRIEDEQYEQQMLQQQMQRQQQ